MLDRGRQTRQTFCSSSLLSPFLFCSAQLFFSSNICNSSFSLSCHLCLSLSLSLRVSSPTTTTNICEIARFTYHLFLCCAERDGSWSYRGRCKGEQIGMGGFGSFFVLHMSLRPLRTCLPWNAVKPCREILRVCMRLLEDIVGKTV